MAVGLVTMNRHPIYIPSRQRCRNSKTADMLLRRGLDFKLVVEDRDFRSYQEKFGKDRVLNLGGNDFGGVAYARNFIKQNSMADGNPWCWQIDDDIGSIFILREKKLISINPALAFRSIERFCEQFDNIGIAGMSANTFVRFSSLPYEVNRFAYTCLLVNCQTDLAWRDGIEDDLDYNLQVLSSGMCTVKFNKYCFQWSTTLSQEGGYTDLYQEGKRLERMRRTLDLWPILPGLAEKKRGGFRIRTERVWSTFTQKLKRNGRSYDGKQTSDRKQPCYGQGYLDGWNP